MTQKIKIRRAKEEDLNKVCRLGRRIQQLVYSKGEGFYTKKELQEYLKSPKDNIFFVALKQDNLVGFIYANIISKDWCMLDIIAVDRKYRGEGVGTMLLDELEKRFKESGALFSYLEVRESNTNARDIYRNRGYEYVRTSENYYGNEDGLIMTKRLTR